jgi:hypothetical protein
MLPNASSSLKIPPATEGFTQGHANAQATGMVSRILKTTSNIGEPRNNDSRHYAAADFALNAVTGRRRASTTGETGVNLFQD